jgi:hypothetical protein
MPLPEATAQTVQDRAAAMFTGRNGKSEQVLYALTTVSSTTAAIARKATLGSSKFLAKPLRCITGSPECLSSFEMMAAISCEGG